MSEYVTLKEFILAILAEREKAVVLQARQHAASVAIICAAATSIVVSVLVRLLIK